MTTQLLQLGSEVGELQGAWAKALDRAMQDRAIRPDEKTDAAKKDPQVIKELGDAGHALHATADKLGIDLLDAMIFVLENEKRSSR